MRLGVCLVTIPLVKVSSLAHEDLCLARDDVVGNLAISGDYICIYERRNVNLQIKGIKGFVVRIAQPTLFTVLVKLCF